MKLPLFSIYDWKSIFNKKKDIKPQSSTTTPSSPPFYPYLNKNFRLPKKNKNDKVEQKGILEHIQQQQQQHKNYQLEEIKLDDQFWEKTLNEIISKTKDYPTIKPIKTKLETLAFQRQVMKSYYIKEMENQAYLDTLHIQSNPWSSTHI
ncbi:unnamed protein product [Cunninghamella blakesleeana]